MFAWTVLLFVRGQRSIRSPPQPPDRGADGFTWVFFVPALNEEITIRDSVERLPRPRDRPPARGRDRRRIRRPHRRRSWRRSITRICSVLRRDAPDARQGKAAALNHAYRSLAMLPRPDRVDRRHRRCRRPSAPAGAAIRRRPFRGSAGRRRPVAGPDLQPQPPADLAAGRRVLRLRVPLSGRAQRLGHRRNGRQRAVQPAQRARRHRRQQTAPGGTA